MEDATNALKDLFPRYHVSAMQGYHKIKHQGGYYVDVSSGEPYMKFKVNYGNINQMWVNVGFYNTTATFVDEVVAFFNAHPE
jgi:hypothetical protein